MKNQETHEEKPGKLSSYALAQIAGVIDQDKARSVFFEFLRPGRSGETCPFCFVEFSTKVRRTFQAFKKVYCSNCGRWSQATTGTTIKCSHASPHELLLVAAMAETGADIRKIAHALGRGPDTIRIWIQRFEDLT